MVSGGPEGFPSWSPMMLEPGELGCHVGIPIYDVGLSHEASSLYRLAILVFMSFRRKDKAEVDTLEYLSKFIRQAQTQAKELEDNKTAMSVDVVYAGYIMALYALVAENSVQSAVGYCSLFATSLCVLKKSRPLGDPDISWITTLWQGLIASLYHVHRDMLFHEREPTEWQNSFIHLHELLEVSSCLLPSELEMAALPLSMTTEVICQEIKTLSMYMQFYLDHFLFRMSPNNSADGDSAAMPIDVVGRRLQEILGRITQLTVHLSSIRDYIYHAYSISESDINTRFHGPANDFLHFPDLQASGLKSTTDPWERDTALALLYSLAQLIKEMMEPAADLNEEGIRHSAIAVCRLCASFPSDSLMALSLTKRSLFWAGLILTKSKYLDGCFHS